MDDCPIHALGCCPDTCDRPCSARKVALDAIHHEQSRKSSDDRWERIVFCLCVAGFLGAGALIFNQGVENARNVNASYQEP